MARVVDDLLDVSRLVQGRISVRRERLDLTVLVCDMVQTFQQQEPVAQVRIAAPDEPMMLDGDAVRLTQVCPIC